LDKPPTSSCAYCTIPTDQCRCLSLSGNADSAFCCSRAALSGTASSFPLHKEGHRTGRRMRACEVIVCHQIQIPIAQILQTTCPTMEAICLVGLSQYDQIQHHLLQLGTNLYTVQNPSRIASYAVLLGFCSRMPWRLASVVGG
jgi:hypothetical protein